MGNILSKTIGKNKKFVSIPVYYRYKDSSYGNVQFQVLSLEEGQKAVQSNEKNIEVLNTKWKPRSWQVNNLIIQNSQTYNPQTGAEELDIIKYQDNLIKQCMISWDLKDEEGNDVSITPDNIDDLPLEIVRYLVSTYDRSNIMSSEERKK
jgi:hypothetical protein